MRRTGGPAGHIKIFSHKKGQGCLLLFLTAPTSCKAPIMSDTKNDNNSNEPAAEEQAEPVLTTNALLGELQRTRVRDDGSCWVYVVMAALFILDHTPVVPADAGALGNSNSTSKFKSKSKKRKRGVKKDTSRTGGIEEPSERDRNLDQAIRNHLHQKYPSRLEGKAVLIVPQEDSFGSFGSQDHLSCLAVEFGVDIALYDETDGAGLRNPSRQWLLLTKGGDWKRATAGQIKARMDDPENTVPVLHVAASRDLNQHFEVYRPKEGWLEEKLSLYEFPAWFRELEENVISVAVENRDDDLYLRRNHAVETWRNAVGGNPDAMEGVADFYESGGPGLPCNVDLSNEWRKKAKDASDINRLRIAAKQSTNFEAASEATYELGFHYENGLKGLAQSDEQAFACYQQSAEHQNATGMAMAASFIMNGRGGAKIDEDRAYCMMLSAIEAGSDRAYLEVGMWHMHGLAGLVAKDLAEAERYLKMAIDIYERRKGGVSRMGEDCLRQAKECIRSIRRGV